MVSGCDASSVSSRSSWSRMSRGRLPTTSSWASVPRIMTRDMRSPTATS